MMNIKNEKINTWDFRSKEGVSLNPLVYSDGRDQKNIINEILDSFDSGENLLFLKAQVSTGKSAIALSLIDILGRGIISVPVKVLQDQYKESYLDRYRIGNLDIAVMKGKSNFKCNFEKGKLCSNSNIVCNRKLKQGETRWKVATKCPSWSPILPLYVYEKIRLNMLFDLDTTEYTGINGDYIYVNRGEDCQYFNQYENYTKEHIALIMNSQKWIIETLLERKPKTDLEVIDEADLFLDGLSFNLVVTHRTLDTIELAEKKKFKNIKILHYMMSDKNLSNITFLTLLEKILKSCITEYSQNLSYKLQLMLLCDQDIMLTKFGKDKNEVLVFTIARPDKIFDILLKRSAKKILLMSATPQSDKVFYSLFNKNINFIEGETEFPGSLKIIKTGSELDINHLNWKDIRYEYWNTLSFLISIAEKPVLCNIFSYKYLPEEEIGNIPCREDVQKHQDKHIKEFLKGKRDVIFTTKFDRGIDLKDEKCRTIILTKLPYPDLTDITLMKLKEYYGPFIFNSYVTDMIKREVLQNIGRVLRSKNDYSMLMSPDKKILELVPKIWKGKKILVNLH